MLISLGRLKFYIAVRVPVGTTRITGIDFHIRWSELHAWAFGINQYFKVRKFTKDNREEYTAMNFKSHIK